MNDRPLVSSGRDNLLRRVRAALGTDNLALAEALAHEILRIEPKDGVAWAVLGHIAALIGRDAEALKWGARANPDVLSRFDAPEHPKVRELLEGCGSCPHDERFILIKSVGQGFWTDVFHVLGALLLAEITNRQPCILWGTESLFLPEGENNAFPLFFNGVGPELLLFFRAAPADEIFPRKWHVAGIESAGVDRVTAPHHGGEGGMAALWLFNRPERLIVSDFPIGLVDLIPWIPEGSPWHGQRLGQIVAVLMERYFLPNWRIRDLVAEQISRLEGRRTMAVHVRGSDKALALNELGDVNGQYPALVEQAIGRGYTIWLMTDSQGVLDQYRDRFGDRIVCLDALRTDSDRGIHHIADPRDRLRLGEEVIADVLVGASCDRFIGNGASSSSCMVDFLMPGDRTRKHLFLPNQYRRRNLTLYPH